jgi:hypothetical protein
MTTKLEVVKFLLQEIEDEYKYKLMYDIAMDRYKLLREEWEEKRVKNDWSGKPHYPDLRMPSKNKIKNNCIKIRQLLLEESKNIPDWS